MTDPSAARTDGSSTDLPPARIAVVGCGAVGSYYGAQLCRAGEDVHLLLRSDYDAVRQHGLEIRSVDGDFHVWPKASRTPAEIGPCDVVLVGLKTTANAELPKLLPPLIGPDTAVISLQNGLGDEEEMAAVVGAERVLGGLCFVCLNRLAPGVIRHTAHGLIVLGEHLRPPRARTREIAGRLRRANVPCRVTENLERAHWEKLVWNIPFNGLGVAGVAGLEALQTGQATSQTSRRHTLPTDELLGDPRWEGMLRELMHEVIAAANALGYRIQPEVTHEQIERTRCMGAYKASTLLDFEAGRPLEIEHLFREPLRRARQAGVTTPRLAALCTVLEALERKG